MLYSENLHVLWYRYFLLDVGAYLSSVSGIAYAKFGLDFGTINYEAYLVTLLLLGMFVMIQLYFSGVYDSESLLHVEYLTYARIMFVTAVAFYVLSFYIRSVSFSRVFFTAVFPTSLILSLGLRAALIAYHRRTLGADIRRPFIAYGFDDDSALLLRRLQSEAQIRILKEYPLDYPIVERLAALTETAAGSDLGIYGNEPLSVGIRSTVDSTNNGLQGEEGLRRSLKGLTGVNKFGVILYENQNIPLNEIVEYCELNYIPFFIVPSINRNISLPFHVLDSKQLLVFGPKDKLLDGTSSRLKRFCDIGMAVIGITLTGWLMIFIWVLVRMTSPGKGIYPHVRLGINGKPTKIYKFRTMYQDSEERLYEMLQDEEVRREYKANFKLDDDPRVTRLGRTLRRTSLDELPQLFNVLKGEISMVGPRPIVPEELDNYGQHARIILRVKPGLTGFWQVSGRSDVSYAERIRLDLYYIHHWSLFFDLKIMWKTIPTVLKGNGAQ